jgi:hypothetical protein
MRVVQLLAHSILSSAGGVRLKLLFSNRSLESLQP